MKKLRKQFPMWALFTLLFLLTVLVQDTVLGAVPILGVRCILLPALFACAALWTGAEAGAVFALAAGTFYALTGAADGPILLAAGVLTAAVSGYACEVFFDRRLFCGILFSLGGLLLALTAVYLARMYLEGAGARMLLLGVRQLAVSFPVCVPLYFLCKWIRKVGP